MISVANDAHARLACAVAEIRDKNSLAWSVLEGKSELTVTKAIALAANRSVGRRVAIPEFKRMDLVFLRDGETAYATRIEAAYQAKAAYLCDYVPNRMEARDPWLGGLLNHDFPKLRSFQVKYRVPYGAGLFYLYEVSEPTCQVKYARPGAVSLPAAVDFIKTEVTGRPSGSFEIDCGDAAGAHVRIHVLVFEPRA